MRSATYRLLTFLLSAVLLFTCVLPAYAADAAGSSGTAAKIGNNTYPTLHAAIEAAADGSTICLEQNILLGVGNESAESITVTKNLTLDLNNFTVVGSGNPVFVLPRSSALTITDTSASGNGNIIGQRLTGPAAQTDHGTAVLVQDGSSLTVAGGSLIGQQITGSTAFADGRAVQSSGTVTLTGGRVIGVDLSGSIDKSNGVFYANGVFTQGGSVTADGQALVAGAVVSGDVNNGSFAAVYGSAAVAAQGHAHLAGAIGTSNSRVQQDAKLSAVSINGFGTSDVTVQDRAQLLGMDTAGSIHSSQCSAISYSGSGNVLIEGGLLEGHGADGTISLFSGNNLTIRNGADGLTDWSGAPIICNADGPAVKLYRGVSGTPSILGGVFTGGNAQIRQDIQDLRDNASGFVTGGIFSNAFAQGQNVPALLPAGTPVEQGTLSAQSVWTADPAGSRYKVGSGNIPNPAPSVTGLYGASLSLAGDVGMNFFYELAPEVVEDSTASVTIAVEDGRSQSLALKDAQIIQHGEKTLYKFSAGVPARQMTANITITLTGANGLNDSHTVSVRDYAKLLLEDDSNRFTPAQKKLVKTMLYYGAQAQQYKNYKIDNLATSVIPTQELSELEHAAAAIQAADLDAFASTMTDPMPAVTVRGVNLSMTSETTLRFIFGSDTDGAAFTVDGAPAKLIQVENQYPCIEIPGILPQNLDRMYSVQITKGDVTGTIKYSALSYVRIVLLHSDRFTPAMVSTARSLYLYNQAANELFTTAAKA